MSIIKILLTTMNAKYIHKNLALRWIYQACPYKDEVELKEFTIKDQVERMSEELLSKGYDVIAFSVYIWNIELTKELIKILKRRDATLHIIAGGPEVSFDSLELLDQGVDALSIGEGEISIWKYIDMLKKEEHYDIEGICTKHHLNKTFTRVPIPFLETLPDPYFCDFDKANMNSQYLYFETSRGCPYNCAYCLSSTDRYVRMFSIEYVMNILHKIAESNVRQVKLLDRTFNADSKRALKIARFMNEECPNQIFQFEIVAETLSEELLVFFCEEADKKRFRLEIGVQSFHALTLKTVGRIQNNERLFEVISRLRDAKVMMHVDLIAGLPYEDYDTFRQSFDTLFSLQVKEIQLGVLKLLKGTRLRDQKDEFGFQEEEKAPYQVEATSWLTIDDMELIEGAASACEKYYNSGKCSQSILEILALQWYDSAFDLFVELGKAYRKLKHPYPPQEFFKLFYQILPNVDKNILDGILMMDYYRLFKQRPPRIVLDKISMELKKDIFTKLVEQGYETQHTLYHYGVVDVGYDDEVGYQVIIYNATQSLPKRYFIDSKRTRIKELSK